MFKDLSGGQIKNLFSVMLKHFSGDEIKYLFTEDYLFPAYLRGDITITVFVENLNGIISDWGLRGFDPRKLHLFREEILHEFSKSQPKEPRKEAINNTDEVSKLMRENFVGYIKDPNGNTIVLNLINVTGLDSWKATQSVNDLGRSFSPVGSHLISKADDINFREESGQPGFMNRVFNFDRNFDILKTGRMYISVHDHSMMSGNINPRYISRLLHLQNLATGRGIQNPKHILLVACGIEVLRPCVYLIQLIGTGDYVNKVTDFMIKNPQDITSLIGHIFAENNDGRIAPKGFSPNARHVFGIERPDVYLYDQRDGKIHRWSIGHQ